jgi:hypothetical protein
MENYFKYYSKQAHSGVGTSYSGHQSGRGLGNWFGNIFKSLLPILKSGYSAVKDELISGGAGLLSDTINQVPISESLENRVRKASSNLTEKAVKKIKNMSGSGYKKAKKGKKSQSSSTRKKGKVVKKKPAKKNTKTKKPSKKSSGKKKQSKKQTKNCATAVTQKYLDIFS